MFAQLGPETREKPLALLDMLPARPSLYSDEHYGRGHGIFRAKNPPMGAQINYWVHTDTGDPVHIAIADSTGFVLRELQGPSRPVLNRVVWNLQANAKHRFPPSPNEEAGPEQFVV